MHRNTPILSETADGSVTSYKMECWQPTGSFKIRGIGNLCRKAHARGATGLVSSSGGNAGMAAAYAARELGMDARIVVPKTTAEFVRHRLVALGAQVQVHGDVWDQADERARRYCEDDGVAYVPPFDHPDIWAGHATLVAECAEAMEPPDEVILSVGGGGLLCGVLQGMHDAGWDTIPLVAVETAGAASLAAAMAADEVVDICEIASIAKTLGARRVAEEALAWTRRHPVISELVGDREAVEACLEFANRQRVLVEPACGAALAVASRRRQASRNALVVVCGGSGVNLDQLNRWRAQFGLDWNQGL